MSDTICSFLYVLAFLFAVRILEIGASTGCFSQSLLSLLNPITTSYTITDRDSANVQKLTERFSSFSVCFCI